MKTSLTGFLLTCQVLRETSECEVDFEKVKSEESHLPGCI